MAHKLLPLHWILLATVFVAILFSFYKYYMTQNYLFLVEAPCDPQAAECYVRDCDEEECPPNGLSEYRLFGVPAELFNICVDNSCQNICSIEAYCEELLCSAQEEIECSTPLVAEQKVP